MPLHNAEPPVKKPRIGEWESTSKDVISVLNDMNGKESLLTTITKPKDVTEFLMTRMTDIIKYHERTKMLTHQQSQDLFKSIVTFLFKMTNMGELWILNFTVHEFVNVYCQWVKGDQAIQLEIEPIPGMTCFFFQCIIYIFRILKSQNFLELH